jgi:nucleotide-binding universal stress UspA family protein
MLRHILIPLDGSTLAEEALQWAKRLVGINSTITLVTALQMPDAMSSILMQPFQRFGTREGGIPLADRELWEKQVSEDAQRYLSQVADELRRDVSARVEMVVGRGDAAELIITTARKREVEAIVMSTHGHSGVQRWLFGSVAIKILEAKVCPVFLVPGLASEEAKDSAQLRAMHPAT